MRKKSLTKRLGAMLVAATMLAGMLSTTAFALEPDPNAKGSIIVHKYSTVTEPTATNPTGEAITNAATLGSFGTPLDGAEFTVYPVTMPTLATGENITNVSIDPDSYVPTFTISTVPTGTRTAVGTLGAASAKTTASGTATWDELDQGYYVLAETKTPTGYEGSDPCVVSIPLTNAAGTGFNYDINVYPKNVNDKPIVKTVDDTTKIYSVGDDVAFTINQAIKNEDADKPVASAADLKDGTNYGKVEITDTLAKALTYKSNTVKLVGKNGEVALAAADYTFTNTDGALKWVLTNAGIDKLIAEEATSVKVNVVTTLGVSETKVTNTAEGLVEAAGDTTPTDPIPSDPVDVPTISITINKEDAADSTTKLAGAKFVVATDAAGTTFLKADGTTTTTIADAVTATTDATGKAVLDGLKYDKANGSQYYLVEAAAPAGYQIKEAAITVEKFDKDLTVETTKNVTVKNYADGTTDPDNPKFSLPLTGGTGTWMFIIIGLLIMGTAITFYVRSKRTKA